MIFRTVFTSACFAFCTYAATGSAQESVDILTPPIDWSAAEVAEKADKVRDTDGVVRAQGVNPADLKIPTVPVISLGSNNDVVRSAQSGFQPAGTGYVYVYDVGSATLSLSGTQAVAAEPMPMGEPVPAAEQTSEPCQFQPLMNPEEPDETENAADCSWFRFNASYVLRLNCQNVEDSRCLTPTYLHNAASNSIVVRGNE